MRPASMPDQPEEDFDNESTPVMREEPRDPTCQDNSASSAKPALAPTAPANDELKKTNKWCVLPDEVVVDTDPEDLTDPDHSRPR